MLHFLLNVELRFLGGLRQACHFWCDCETEFSKTDSAIGVITHAPQYGINDLFPNDRFFVKLVEVYSYCLSV